MVNSALEDRESISLKQRAGFSLLSGMIKVTSSCGGKGSFACSSL